MKTTEYCPDTLMLAKYFGGSISDKEKVEMEAHFADCDDCLDTFITAGEILADEELSAYKPASEAEALSVMKKQKTCSAPPAENSLTAFFRRIYVFLSEIFLPPRPATVRSAVLCSSASVQPEMRLEKEFDTFRTVLSLERRENSHADIAVSVTGDSARVIRLSLESEENGGDSRSFRGESEIFDKVPFGICHLIIRKENLEEDIISFKINGAGIHEC